MQHASCPGKAADAYQQLVRDLPGKIEAEDFDSNGFSDNTTSNEGGAYRTETGVDIKAISGGHAVGWTTLGEWLEYTVNVPSDGEYDVTLRAGAIETGRTLRLSQCDKTLLDVIDVPQVSAWGEFKISSVGKVRLTAGVQKIRLNITGADGVDIDWLHIGPYSGSPDPTTPPLTTTGEPGNYPIGNAPVKSSGCGTDGKSSLLTGGTSVAQGLATSTRLKLTSNNASREYIIDIPSDYDKSKPYRLFYTSHWIGSTNTAVATGETGNGGATNWGFYGLRRESLAAKEPAIFVAPQSVGSTWQETDNRFLFDDILKKVSSSLCIDMSRVFATGFSFGGMITYSLSTNHQKSIRAAVGIGPANYNIWLPSPIPKEPIAWMSTTGMGDTTTPWDGGNGRGAKYIGEQRARDNGCTAATIPTWTSSSPSRHVCYDYKGCKSNYPVKVCTFNGGHQAAPHDTGSGDNGATTWIASESWKFFTQF